VGQINVEEDPGSGRSRADYLARIMKGQEDAGNQSVLEVEESPEARQARSVEW
jgi:hypothetical protein